MECNADENAYSEKESSEIKHVLAVLFAFIMGLTIGNIDRDTIVNIRDKYIVTTEASLINRENRTTTEEYSFSAETTPTAEAEEELTSVEEESYIQITEYSTTKEDIQPSANITEKVTEEKNNEEILNIYRTPTGKRYHFSASCAGDNRIISDLEEVTSLGLTPCKKCADG